MKYTKWLLTSAILFALASIIAQRVFRAFTVAETLAVCSFALGLVMFWYARRQPNRGSLVWPTRLVGLGSMIGIGGLVIKLVLVFLGIGVAEHDMSNHEAAPNPLLVHIHHLFFNIGFLFFLMAMFFSAVIWLRQRSNRLSS